MDNMLFAWYVYRIMQKNINHQGFAMASLHLYFSGFFLHNGEPMQQITSWCTALQLEIESAVSQAVLMNSLHWMGYIGLVSSAHNIALPILLPLIVYFIMVFIPILASLFFECKTNGFI